jgi:hypothetical protein
MILSSSIRGSTLTSGPVGRPDGAQKIGAQAKITKIPIRLLIVRMGSVVMAEPPFLTVYTTKPDSGKSDAVLEKNSTYRARSARAKA